MIKEEIKDRGALVSFTHGVRLLDRPAIKADAPAFSASAVSLW